MLFKKKHIIFLILLFFTLTTTVYAADPNVTFWGGQESAIKQAIGLSDKDPRVIAAKMIRAALGLLGIIAVVLIIYAGWVYMSSEGDDQKVNQAKAILKNAVIGLIIIFSAFAIVSFIIKAYFSGGSGGGLGGPGGTPPGPGGGFGVIGECSIESVYPEPGQVDVPRNTSIIVTFKEEIASTTIMDADGKILTPEGDERVKFYQTNNPDNLIKDIHVSTNDNKTFVFIPDKYLGSASVEIWHTVYLSNSITKLDGKGIFDNCSTDYFEWQFEVSTKLDLNPPQVQKSGVFPIPDNLEDLTVDNNSAIQAKGAFIINVNPKIYLPAKVVNIYNNPTTAKWPTPKTNNDPHCLIDNTSPTSLVTLQVSITSEGVKLNNKDGNLLGAGELTDKTISFDYCNLQLLLDSKSSDIFTTGNAWEILMHGEQQADSLSIGNIVYNFVSKVDSENQILIGDDKIETAKNMVDIINSNADSNVSANQIDNKIELTAKTAGSAGNEIILAASTNNSGAFTIISMSGGLDKENNITIQDQKDQPINSVIQINFNEAINPLTVSGKADEVKDWIKIVNANPDAIPSGTNPCLIDADCVSFNCVEKVCQGDNDYLQGEFKISNQYRTVEFISDNQCGVNGCGEKIYCLPKNSNLKVELKAANLIDCGTDNCANQVEYNICVSGRCQNSGGVNLPLSVVPLSGIADVALNSLDGNRDKDADGPNNFYNENNPDINTGDNFQWSFFVSDQLDLTPPEITSTTPAHNDASVNLSDPVKINFNKLMMASSLKTGSVIINNGKEDIEHKLINLWNFANKPIGYWITKNDIDNSSPLDGQSDYTQAEIRHSIFTDTISYRSQVGSGVKDSYQNCFKPSKGPACSGVDEVQPSCCAGTASTDSSCN